MKTTFRLSIKIQVVNILINSLLEWLWKSLSSAFQASNVKNELSVLYASFYENVTSFMNDPDYLIREGNESVRHLPEVGHVLEERAALLLQVFCDGGQLRIENPKLLKLIEMEA